MPEPVDAWWERRRASTGRAVPYAVGTYFHEWHRYPVLVKQRKDRLLRRAGWEVVRVRIEPLPAIGPFDLVAKSVSNALADRLVERFREIRGPLFVDAYLR